MPYIPRIPLIHATQEIDPDPSRCFYVSLNPNRAMLKEDLNLTFLQTRALLTVSDNKLVFYNENGAMWFFFDDSNQEQALGAEKKIAMAAQEKLMSSVLEFEISEI